MLLMSRRVHGLPLESLSRVCKRVRQYVPVALKDNSCSQAV